MTAGQQEKMQMLREEKLAANLKALLRRWVEGDQTGFRVCPVTLHTAESSVWCPSPGRWLASQVSAGHCSSSGQARWKHAEKNTNFRKENHRAVALGNLRGGDSHGVRRVQQQGEPQV